jgi:hypothetical protein
MKKFFKLIGIIAIVAIIGLSFSSCDDGIGEDEGKVTIQSISSISLIITNYSKYEVTITVRDNKGIKMRTETIPVNRSVTYSSSSLTPPVTVTYSPKSKVNAQTLSGGGLLFSNK